MMENNIKKKQRGFTLIEVVMSVAIFSLIALGLIVLISSIFTTNGKLSILSADTDQGRRAIFKFMQEIRNSTYANTGGYPLAEAGNQQLVFYSNIDGGTDVERVRYYISNGMLYRGVVKPTGSPYAYNLGNENNSVVQKNVANGANPLFYYYNSDYTGTEFPLSQPVNLTQVKVVKMDLRIFNKGGATGSNYFSTTATGTIRSLKTNLGD